MILLLLKHISVQRNELKDGVITVDEKIMLKVENLSVNYGHIEALKNVSVEVKKGQICSIIGANGAGKSTLLKTISGLVKPVSGTIYFEGKPLPKKAHKIVAEGIVHVPEGRKTFSGLTIEDNLLVGGTLTDKSRLAANLEKQYELFPILKERKNQFAGTLSGGEQQMLAVARGLMSEPKIILLDEPSMGLAPLIVNQIYKLIEQIRESGITVLLIEQNAKKALSICDFAYVLENGKIKLSGSGEELLASDEVRKAYLGG
jgi:branched-chain amino acid transport system ATP-binding protein